MHRRWARVALSACRTHVGTQPNHQSAVRAHLYSKPPYTIYLIEIIISHFLATINLAANIKFQINLVDQLHRSLSNVDRSAILGHASKFNLVVSFVSLKTSSPNFNMVSHSRHI